MTVLTRKNSSVSRIDCFRRLPGICALILQGSRCLDTEWEWEMAGRPWAASFTLPLPSGPSYEGACLENTECGEDAGLGIKWEVEYRLPWSEESGLSLAERHCRGRGAIPGSKVQFGRSVEQGDSLCKSLCLGELEMTDSVEDNLTFPSSEILVRPIKAQF